MNNIWKIGDIILNSEAPFNTHKDIRYIKNIDSEYLKYMYPHWIGYNNIFRTTLENFQTNFIYTDIFRELGE